MASASARRGWSFTGTATVDRKAQWPRWTPTTDMIKREPGRYAKWAGGMAGGDDQSAGRPRALPVQGRQGHALPDPWNQRAEHDRRGGVVRLYPDDEPGRHRPLQSHSGGFEGRGALKHAETANTVAWADPMTIGPIVLPPERFATLLGLLAFILLASVLTKRVSALFNLWGTIVLVGSLAAARLTHVVLKWSFFKDDPLRAFAVWQGGFVWVGALPVIIVASLLLLRNRRLIAWATVPSVAGVLVAHLAFQLIAAGAPISPPVLTLASADGATVNLAVPSGQISVINLWATWCPPCRREMPVLAAAEADNPDVQFIFVNQGEAPQTVRAYLDGQNLSAQKRSF